MIRPPLLFAAGLLAATSHTETASLTVSATVVASAEVSVEMDGSDVAVRSSSNAPMVLDVSGGATTRSLQRREPVVVEGFNRVTRLPMPARTRAMAVGDAGVVQPAVTVEVGF